MVYIHFSTTTTTTTAGAVVTGYESVIARWASSFSATGTQPHLKMKNIKLFYQGYVAVVTCTLETEKTNDKNVQKNYQSRSNSIVVTNLFVKTFNSDKYAITAHISTIDHGDSDNNAYMGVLKDTYRDPLRPARKKVNFFKCLYLCIYTYIDYIYTYIHTYVFLYIYINICGCMCKMYVCKMIRIYV